MIIIVQRSQSKTTRQICLLYNKMCESHKLKELLKIIFHKHDYKNFGLIINHRIIKGLDMFHVAQNDRSMYSFVSQTVLKHLLY